MKEAHMPYLKQRFGPVYIFVGASLEVTPDIGSVCAQPLNNNIWVVSTKGPVIRGLNLQWARVGDRYFTLGSSQPPDHESLKKDRTIEAGSTTVTVWSPKPKPKKKK